MQPAWLLEGRSEEGEDRALSEGLPWLFLWALVACFFFFFLKIAGIVPSCDQDDEPTAESDAPACGCGLWSRGSGWEWRAPSRSKMEKPQLLTAGPNVFGKMISAGHHSGGGTCRWRQGGRKGYGSNLCSKLPRDAAGAEQVGQGKAPRAPLALCAWLSLLRASCVGESEVMSRYTAGGQWAFRELWGGVPGHLLLSTSCVPGAG